MGAALASTGDVLPAVLTHANPGTDTRPVDPRVHPRTVELRVADGSADVHLLLAGMTVVARLGLGDLTAWTSPSGCAPTL